MQFNNSQSGYQNFIPVYDNPSSTASYFYQQPEEPVTTNLMVSNIPGDSLLYDMYDYKPSMDHAATTTTGSVSGTPTMLSQPSSPPMSPPASARGQKQATADRKRPKRKQVKNACVNCQKACKKCDDGRPCQRCIKLGLTATCTNSPRKERKKGVKRGPYKKRQHLDGAHGSSKLSDWEESSTEFVAYATSEVPTMYQTQYQVATSPNQASPLSSSPLSSDAGLNYLAHGTSATTAADASSASAASLSPVSPHFPNNSWEDYQYTYPTAQQPNTANHHPIDVHQSYHQPSIIVDNLDYDIPCQYSAQPVYTTKPEVQDYFYPSQTTPVVPATVPSTSSWTYSNYIEQQQQQQQPAQQQLPATGYWQMFLENAYISS